MAQIVDKADLVQVGNRLISKDEHFMNSAVYAATLSTCLSVKVGAAIAKDGVMLAIGYNHPLPGSPPCSEIGFCYPGLDRCGGDSVLPSRAIHAEVAAIWRAQKLGFSVEGASLYCTHRPCSTCLKFAVMVGIAEIIVKGDCDREESPLSDLFVKDGLIEVRGLRLE